MKLYIRSLLCKNKIDIEHHSTIPRYPPSSPHRGLLLVCLVFQFLVSIHTLSAYMTLFICKAWHVQISRKMEYFSFWHWSSCISILLKWHKFILCSGWKYINIFLYLFFVARRLHWFCNSAIIGSSAIDTEVQVSLWYADLKSSRQILGSGIDLSYGRFIFFSRHLHTVSHRSLTRSPSHPHLTGIPFGLHP